MDRWQATIRIGLRGSSRRGTFERQNQKKRRPVAGGAFNCDGPWCATAIALIDADELQPRRSLANHLECSGQAAEWQMCVFGPTTVAAGQPAESHPCRCRRRLPCEGTASPARLPRAARR